MKFLLKHSMRIQADLVDQLLNSSEKRLARILLLMAEFGKPGEPEQYIPNISQETLAEMIGTTRSRVSFFMNRFRKLGFVSYNGRIQVHRSRSMWSCSINCPSITPRSLQLLPYSEPIRVRIFPSPSALRERLGTYELARRTLLDSLNGKPRVNRLHVVGALA
jgi:hypothetical protein